MGNLTDLEICKRIAEIEGATIEVDDGRLLRKEMVASAFGGTGIDKMVPVWSEYNPLTDDALCFQLMAKHEVSIDSYLGVARIDSDYTHKPPVAEFSYMDITLNKAICLAIIEAHKEQ